jgi:hypothetical protein
VPQAARVRVVGALAAMLVGEREQARAAAIVVPDVQEVGDGRGRALAVRARREIARFVIGVIEAEQAFSPS